MIIVTVPLMAPTYAEYDIPRSLFLIETPLWSQLRVTLFMYLAVDLPDIQTNLRVVVYRCACVFCALYMYVCIYIYTLGMYVCMYECIYIYR